MAMTVTSSHPKSAFSPEILAAQAAVAENPGDLVAHLSLASALEQEEFWAEALAAYQEVQRLDQERLFTATLDKAIADIQAHLGPTDSSIRHLHDLQVICRKLLRLVLINCIAA